MESKMDFESLKMIKTNLFLLTDLTGPNIFVRLLPTTDAISPSLVSELKVTGIFAKQASSPNEPIHHVLYVSGLLSKVRVDR
jgi:hypothetical protein